MIKSLKKVFYLSLLLLFVVAGTIYWFSNFEESPKSIEFTEEIPLETINNNFSLKNVDLDFKYVLQPSNCDDNLNNFSAVIIVTSYFGNVETRSSMRRAYSNQELLKLGFRRFFLLGEAPKDKFTSQKAIINESDRFQDIIQGNFIEAYRNLTYKHLMGLKWAGDHCQRAKYLIKMDDDIVVDIRKVVQLLKNPSRSGNNFDKINSGLIAGYIMRNMIAIREPANKWFVTETEYGQSVYPPFVSGWFYITTPQIAQKLFSSSIYFKYFWIDDVFVTGILARKLKIRHYDLGKYFAVHSEYLQCCVNDFKIKLDCDCIVGPNGGDNNLFYDFNEALKICYTNKCTKRDKPINQTCIAERKTHIGLGSGIIENYRLI